MLTLGNFVLCRKCFSRTNKIQTICSQMSWVLHFAKFFFFIWILIKILLRNSSYIYIYIHYTHTLHIHQGSFLPLLTFHIKVKFFWMFVNNTAGSRKIDTDWRKPLLQINTGSYQLLPYFQEENTTILRREPKWWRFFASIAAGCGSAFLVEAVTRRCFKRAHML